MHVIVLGAGVVGVTAAWYLRQSGHEVTVVDRQPEAAMETSFANGGQISVSHAEPWANPQAPGKVLKWLGREDAPLLFRPRADFAQWEWGARFLLECLPGRTRRNTLAILALAKYSRERLRELRAATGIEYDCLTRGILQVFTDTADWRAAGPKAELMRGHGLEVELKTPAQCLEIEPALAHGAPLAGGMYTPGDESGDARKFTLALARLARERGVCFRFGAAAEAFEHEADRVSALRIAGGERLRADTFVIALGSWSPLLARDLGLRLPVYPVKGYSITVPIGPDHRAPTVSITDEAGKLVFSRLGDRLRAAGTAELAGWDTSLTEVRWRAVERRAFEIFPRGGDRSRIEAWTGLRPATPGNVPLVGRTGYPNLFLDTGHGTLGWTLACGSAAAISDIVSGRRPEPAFPFL